MNDTNILRANILGGLNAYLLELGDEDILDEWFAYGIPDECDEDTLMEIASDDRMFRDITKLFTSLI